MTGKDVAGEPVSLVIYGASGFAASIRDMIVHGLEPGAFSVAAFIDDFRGDRGETLDGAPVIGFDTWRTAHRHLPVVLSVGAPAARRKLAARVTEAGGELATVYRIMGAVSPRITVGEGAVIGYPAYVGPYTAIGRCVLVMPMSVVGHDVTVGDFVTICSSASIAGYVVIEDEVFVGAGAVIVNGTPERPMRIGRGARIAAGAVVTKAVEAGVSVTGNPARDVREIAAGRLAARKEAAPPQAGRRGWRRARRVAAGALALLVVLFGLSAYVKARNAAGLRAVRTCFETGGGALHVCHAAADEGVFYRPGRTQVAYNTQIVALGSGKYATVLHSEARDMDRYRKLTGRIRPGDSIKVGLTDAAGRPDALYKAPPLDFRIWGSLTDPASALYYGYDVANQAVPGLSGGGNPMVVRGLRSGNDPFYYMFFLGVASDGLRGVDWRDVLLEARTRDFKSFDLLQLDAHGDPAWAPFAGDGARPAVVRDAAGHPIVSNHPARAETGASGDPGRPAGAVVTAGVFGSIARVGGTYYYFYTDQDPDDASRNHLYVRTARDVSTDGRWSEPRIVLDMPPEIMVRVAKAPGMDRWAIFYNCLRDAAPFVSDVCLQYTETLDVDGPRGLGALKLFDGDTYNGFSSHALGLIGAETAYDAGEFIKGQHFYLTDEDGNLTAPPGAPAQAGGLLTWMDVPRTLDIFGAPTYWARWEVEPVKP